MVQYWSISRSRIVDLVTDATEGTSFGSEHCRRSGPILRGLRPHTGKSTTYTKQDSAQHLGTYGGMVSETAVLGNLSPAHSGSTGFHLPRVRRRDNFYAQLEDERAREAGFK